MDMQLSEMYLCSQPRVYSIDYLSLARGNLGCIVKPLTNDWPHPEYPTVASILVRDPNHERVRIYSGLNQSKIANLGYIVKASNPLSRIVLGCIVTDPQLRLGEEHGYRAGIPRKSHPSNK